MFLKFKLLHTHTISKISGGNSERHILGLKHVKDNSKNPGQYL